MCCITSDLYFPYQIEREREEHLKPRLQLHEESSSPSPKEVREDSEDEPEEEEPEEEKPAPLPPNMKATMRPVEASNGASSMSEDNEDSNFPPASEDSQGPVYGPSKEENTKLSFGGLKLGKYEPPRRKIENSALGVSNWVSMILKGGKYKTQLWGSQIG